MPQYIGALAPSAAFGVLSYDMAHLLGGAALMLSFALLFQRRVTSVINIYAMQATVLAATASWQGWSQGDPAFYVTALITLAAKGVAIPLALHRIVVRLQITRTIETTFGI